MCKASFSKEKLEKVSKNISMESLITIVKKRRAYAKAISEKDDSALDLTVTCAQCEEDTPATWWCLTCDDAEICEECYKSHCRLKIFKSHWVIELEKFIQSPSFVLNCRPHCMTHKTEPLEHHCKACHIFKCEQCVNLDNMQCKKPCWQLCNNTHEYEAIDDLYETKAQKIKEVNLNIQAAYQKVAKKLRHIEHATKELNRLINEEIAWVQERFQEIRNFIDKHERDLLLNLESIHSTGENLLQNQSVILSQCEKQLNHYKNFTSSILLPFRLQEVFMRSEWIPSIYQEEDSDDNELAYDTEDIVISRGSLDLDDLTQKLLSLHEIFHNPHVPNCSVELLSKSLELVKVKVTLKDKYGLLVPNQMCHLEIQSEKCKSFFTELDWKHEGDGIYMLSYCPLVREIHNLSITWKDSVLGTDLVIYDSMELKRKVGFQYYNKRILMKPLFLARTPENCIIISDPGDSRLVVHCITVMLSLITIFLISLQQELLLDLIIAVYTFLIVGRIVFTDMTRIVFLVINITTTPLQGLGQLVLVMVNSSVHRGLLCRILAVYTFATKIITAFKFMTQQTRRNVIAIVTVKSSSIILLTLC